MRSKIHHTLVKVVYMSSKIHHTSMCILACADAFWPPKKIIIGNFARLSLRMRSMDRKQPQYCRQQQQKALNMSL
jgi:hypothetical protein